MLALVIPAAGHRQLVDVFEEYGRPPRNYKVFLPPRRLIPQARPDADDKIEEVSYRILELPIHRVSGGALPEDVIAYWPSDWMEDWGVEEVCRYFGIEFRKEDYGSSGYIRAVSDDLVVRPTHGMGFQRSQTPSSSPSAISQGRLALPAGSLLPNEGGSKS